MEYTDDYFRIPSGDGAPPYSPAHDCTSQAQWRWMQPAMRIAEVIDIHPKKFGSFEKYCVANAHYLKTRGHEHILFFSHELCVELSEALKRTKTRVLVHWFHRLGLVDAVWLSKFVLSERVDIVHLHFYEPYNAFTLMSRILSCKTFVTFHMSVELSEAPNWIQIFKRLRTRLLSFGVAGVFCVSRFSKQRFLANYHEDERKVSVVYNGLSLDFFNHPLSTSVAAQGQPLRVICVAALIEVKGVQDLIEAVALAMAEGIALEVTIAGEGPMLSTLQELVKLHKLGSAVKFLGLRSDVPQLLAQNQLAVVPSHWDEAFGYTVVEAMAAGIPVIASAVGAIPEIVVHGVTGFLVQKGSPLEIVKYLKVINRDPGLRNLLGRNALRRVEEWFNVTNTCEAQLSHYIRELEKRT